MISVRKLEVMSFQLIYASLYCRMKKKHTANLALIHGFSFIVELITRRLVKLDNMLLSVLVFQIDSSVKVQLTWIQPL